MKDFKADRHLAAGKDDEGIRQNTIYSFPFKALCDRPNIQMSDAFQKTLVKLPLHWAPEEIATGLTLSIKEPEWKYCEKKGEEKICKKPSTLLLCILISKDDVSG